MDTEALVYAELGGEAVLVGRRHLRSNNSWMHGFGGALAPPSRPSERPSVARR